MLRVWLGGREYRIERALGGRRWPSEIDPRDLLREVVHAGHRADLEELVYATHSAPQWVRDAQLVERALEAIEAGSLAIERVAAPEGAAWVPPTDAEAPAGLTSDPVVATNESPQTWFELRLLDEIGSPIEGVTVAMSPGGSTPTDDAGAARATAPSAPQGGGEVQSLDELRAVVAPRWNEVRPEPWIEDAPRQTFIPLMGSPSTSVALPAERPYTLVIQPWVVRAHLDGLVFDTNKSFLLPDAVHRADGDAPIDRLREWLDVHPDTTALVVGHTDPSGDPSYNDTLSLERAETFIAFLTGDVEHWLGYYSHPAWEKRWGVHEDRSMLQALAERWDLPAAGRVQAFQAWAGVEVDGFIGPETRRALITAYMDLQDTEAALPESFVAHGCGESFPKMDKPDRQGVEGTVDPDMEDQRRVEVFLFPADTGVQPPPPGTVSPAQSVEYPEWVRRARRSRDLRADAGLAAMAVWTTRKHDASEVVPGTRVSVTGPDDETTAFVRTADDFGVAHFEGLEPGRYRILADKPGFEPEERVVQLRRSGVTDENDDLVLLAVDGDVAAPDDVDESQRVDVPMDGPLEITRLVGKTPSWDPDSSAHRHKMKALEKDPDVVALSPDRLVVFRQGESVTVHWTVTAPHRPEVELHGAGALGGACVHGVDVPEKPGANHQWSGTIELDLRARNEDGTPNLDFAPPQADGHYELVAKEGGKEAKKKLPVAGVAFFGAFPAAKTKLTTCSARRRVRPDGAMTDVPVLHAEHGNMLEGEFRKWLKEPHGYSTAQGDVRLEWVVVGSHHAGMQLEILGAAPTSIAKPGPEPPASFDFGWAIDRMSEIHGPLSGEGSTTVKNELVTLRATLHVFRKGAHAGQLNGALWGSKNRLGGSVLLVAEDRTMKKLATKDAKKWMAPIHPHPSGGGFYRAVREASIDEPVLGDHQRGADITLEIITRVGAIWKQTYGDRPFGLGDIYGPFPAHKTHHEGRAFDVMALRGDGKVEVSTGGNTNTVTVIDGDTKTTGSRTRGRATKKAAVTPPFDPIGMQHLLMLFVDVMDAVAEPKNQERFLQVVFDDERVTDAVRKARPHVSIGTEIQIMETPQQTHLWHTHFLIRVPTSV